MYHDGIMKEYIKPLQDIVGTSNDGYDVREEVNKVNDRVDEVSSQLEHIATEIIDINTFDFSDSSQYIITDKQHITKSIKFENLSNIKFYSNKKEIEVANLTDGIIFKKCNNIYIENITFDFTKSTTKGIKFENCNNIIIKNCTFKNIKEKALNEGYLYAINFLGCKDVIVDNCLFDNIDGTTSANGVARAIQVSNNYDISSERIKIDKCTFDTILPVTDGDAIHFNQPDTPMNAVVSNCTFIDCAKRGVKVQTSLVTVEKCRFYDVELTETIHDSAITFFYNNCKATENHIYYNNSNRGIFVYNTRNVSNIILTDNYINITSDNNYDGISIGMVNDTYIYQNITIENNKIYGNKLRYSIYLPHCLNSVVHNNYIESGSLVIGLTDQLTYYTENIKILNNTINPEILLRGSNIIIQNNNIKSGIKVDSNVTNTENVIIDNNTFDGCNYGLISSTNNISGYKITNNIFKSITNKDIQINGDNHIIENNIYHKMLGGSYCLYNQGFINFNPGSLSANSGITSSGITVPNARLGDFVIVSAPYNLKNCIAHGYVSSSTQVQIRVQNVTASQVDFSEGVWKVKIIKS